MQPPSPRCASPAAPLVWSNDDWVLDCIIAAPRLRRYAPLRVVLTLGPRPTLWDLMATDRPFTLPDTCPCVGCVDRRDPYVPPRLAELPCVEALERIIAHVEAEYMLSRAALRAKDRTPLVTEARMLLCYIAHHDAGLGVTALGRAVSRDHSTILSAIARITTILEHEQAAPRNGTPVTTMLRDIRARLDTAAPAEKPVPAPFLRRDMNLHARPATAAR